MFESPRRLQFKGFRMSLMDEIKNKQKSVGDLVKGKTAKLIHYRSGLLLYETQDGFQFPVPIEDTGEAEFKSEHNALELMRWIRKQVDLIQKEA